MEKLVYDAASRIPREIGWDVITLSLCVMESSIVDNSLCVMESSIVDKNIFVI